MNVVLSHTAPRARARPYGRLSYVRSACSHTRTPTHARTRQLFVLRWLLECLCIHFTLIYVRAHFVRQMMRQKGGRMRTRTPAHRMGRKCGAPRNRAVVKTPVCVCVCLVDTGEIHYRTATTAKCRLDDTFERAYLHNIRTLYITPLRSFSRIPTTAA